VGTAERKLRNRVDRKRRIVTAARAIAEREGWPAVTIRRLADEIEYSQPVLYSHFQNRDAIVAAVAVEGFKELTEALQGASIAAEGTADALRNSARAYLAFALRNPALYEAMFILPTELLFAEVSTKPELRAAFAALAAVMKPFSADVAAAAEVYWASLHGLVELELSGRIRRGMHEERIALLVQIMAGGAAGSGATGSDDAAPVHRST